MGISVGTLILGAELASTAVVGEITLGAIVGSLTLATVATGASFAAQTLLAPDPPKPEAGHLTQNKTIPPRQRGWGRRRMGGFYGLYTSVDQISTDVVLFHQGKICAFVGYFLHDDRVNLTSGFVVGVLNADGSNISFGTVPNDGRYVGTGGRVAIETRLGEDTETYYSNVEAVVTSGVWDSSHRGDGIASIALICDGPGAAKFTKTFPQNLPIPTVIVDMSAVWDFRDSAQSPTNKTTWIDYPDYDAGVNYTSGTRALYLGVVYISLSNPISASNIGNQPDISNDFWTPVFSNPILQLVDYIITPALDGGMGLSRDILITPVLANLISKANICDELVTTFREYNSTTVYSMNDEVVFEGVAYISVANINVGNDPDSSPDFWLYEFPSKLYEPRYRSDGYYSFENEPADVISRIMSTCDGWTEEDIDGSLVVEVGKFIPADASVSFDNDTILGGEIRRGLVEKDVINEIQITYTNIYTGYKSQLTRPIRDEADISRRGKVLSKPLDLTWVQSPTQARRLAQRRMVMAQATKRGTLITPMYGLLACGKRWVTIDEWGSYDIAGQVVEIQSLENNFETCLSKISWIAVDTIALETLPF